MSTQEQITQVTDAGLQQASLQEKLVRRLHRGNRIAITILSIATAIVAFLFIAIIIKLIVNGIGPLLDPQFYGSTATYGVGPEIFNTVYILVLTEIILIPISLSAAIYLIEYARQGLLVQSIHFAAETLAGVPSIVLGLFGYAVFASVLGGYSRLAGALTLLCLNFPIALRLFEDALTSVEREQREGGLALGSTRWHVIRTVILPSALPGIITGFVLSAGKIVGEAAALIYTMGGSNPANVFTLNPQIASDTLSINIYNVQSTGGGLTHIDAQTVLSGSSALLVILLLLINLIARWMGNLLQKKITAA